MKRREELGSPCFTPKYEWMHLDVKLLYLMAERTDEYIDLIALVIFVLTFSAISFCHRKRRDLHRRAAYSICESWFLIHQDVYHDLFVCS